MVTRFNSCWCKEVLVPVPPPQYVRHGMGRPLGKLPTKWLVSREWYPSKELVAALETAWKSHSQDAE